MKIAIDANVLTLPPTGVAKSLLHLMNNVARLRPDWNFLSFSAGDMLADFDFNAKHIKQHNNFLSKINVAGRLKSCDFVHYHWNGGILPNARMCKNIVMIHDVLPLEIPNYFTTNADKSKYTNQMRFTVQNAAVILTPSNYSKEKLMEFFAPSCPIFVLPHGITMPRVTNVKKGEYYIYVGGYAPRKGLVQLLREFINMRTSRKLYFVGTIGYFSDEFKSLVQRAIQMGILKQCGYVDENTLANLTAGARGLIYPSQWEGFGLPPIEAMSVGTPAFVTRGTCIPEICGNAGIYFDPYKPGDLELTLDKFESKNPSEIISHGIRHSKQFNWDRSAREYIRILESIEEIKCIS